MLFCPTAIWSGFIVAFLLLVVPILHPRNKETSITGRIFGLLLSTAGLGLFIGMIFNGASTTVVTVNGLNKEDCISKEYFLFKRYDKQTLFLAPWGKSRVINNTEHDISYYAVTYGSSAEPNSIDIPSRACVKVPVAPTFYFEYLPKKIMWRSRSHSNTRTVGVLLRNGNSPSFLSY